MQIGSAGFSHRVSLKKDLFLRELLLENKHVSLIYLLSFQLIICSCSVKNEHLLNIFRM